MKTPMTWFRFYSEAIKDTKLRRIARKTRSSPAEVMGIWCIVLSLASESPVRGALLLSDGLPVTEDDIADIAGCDVSETLQELECNGMIAVTEGVIRVTAWDKRQFASDTSTARVQEYRNKHKKHGETFQQRYRNVSETPPETETETETDNRRGSSEPSMPEQVPVVVDVVLSDAVKAYETHIGQVASYTVAEELKELSATYPSDWVPRAIELAKGKRSPMPYVRSCLRNWQNGDGAPPVNGNGAAQKSRLIVFEDPRDRA